MKIQKSKNTKRILPALILAIVLLIAGTLFTFFYLKRNSSDNALSSNGEASKPIRKSDEELAKNIEKNPSTKEETPNSDKPSTPTSNGEGKEQVQMIASADTSTDTVYIRGGVNYPVSAGSCYAVLRGPSGQSLRKDTIVLQNPSSTDCKTISIPKTELSPGKWNFKLYYTSDKYEGVSDETSFTI